MNAINESILSELYLAHFINIYVFLVGVVVVQTKMFGTQEEGGIRSSIPPHCERCTMLSRARRKWRVRVRGGLLIVLCVAAMVAWRHSVIIAVLGSRIDEGDVACLSTLHAGVISRGIDRRALGATGRNWWIGFGRGVVPESHRFMVAPEVTGVSDRMRRITEESSFCPGEMRVVDRHQDVLVEYRTPGIFLLGRRSRAVVLNGTAAFCAQHMADLRASARCNSETSIEDKTDLRRLH